MVLKGFIKYSMEIPKDLPLVSVKNSKLGCCIYKITVDDAKSSTKLNKKTVRVIRKYLVILMPTAKHRKVFLVD